MDMEKRDKGKYENKLKTAESFKRTQNEENTNRFIVGQVTTEKYKVRRWNGRSGRTENTKSRSKRRRMKGNDSDEDDDAANTNAGGGGGGGAESNNTEVNENESNTKDGEDHTKNEQVSEEIIDKDQEEKKDEEPKEEQIKIVGVTSVSGTNIPKTTPKPSKKRFPTCSVACGGNRPVIIRRSPTTSQAYTSTSFEQGKPIPPGCSYKCTMMPERTPSGKSFIETGEINRCSVSCTGMYSPNPSKSHSSCASWKKKSFPIVLPPREPSLKPEVEPEAAPSRVSVGVGVGDEEKEEVEIKAEGEAKLEGEEEETLAEGELKAEKVGSEKGSKISRVSGASVKIEDEGEVSRKTLELVGSAAELGEEGDAKEKIEAKEEKEAVVAEEGIKDEGVEEDVELKKEVVAKEGAETEVPVEEGKEKAELTKVESEIAEKEAEKAEEAALDVIVEEAIGEPEKAPLQEAPPVVTAAPLPAAPVLAPPVEPAAAPSAPPVVKASITAPPKASAVPVPAVQLPPTAATAAISTEGIPKAAASGIPGITPPPPPPATSVLAAGAPSLEPIITPSGVVVPRVTSAGAPRVSITAEGVPISGVERLSTAEGVPATSGVPLTTESAGPAGLPVTAGGVPLTVGGIPVLVEGLSLQPGGIPVTVDGRPVTAGGIPVVAAFEPEAVEEEEEEDPDKVDFDVAKYAQRVYNDDDKNCACQKPHEKVKTLLKKTFEGHICCFSKPECLVIHGCVSIHNVKGKMKVGISNCNKPTDGVKTCRNDPCLFPYGQTVTVAAAKAKKKTTEKKVSIVPSEPEMVPEAEADEINIELEPEEEIPGEVVCIHHPLRLLVNGCCNAHKEQSYGLTQRVMPFQTVPGFQNDTVFSNPSVENSSYEVSWSSSEIALHRAKGSEVSRFLKDSFIVDESESLCSIQRVDGRTTLNISSYFESSCINAGRTWNETQTSKAAMLTCRTNTDNVISPMYSNEISNLYYNVYNQDYNVVRNINFGLMEQLKHVSTQYVKSKRGLCEHAPECPLVPKCFRFKESGLVLTEKDIRCVHEPSCIQIPICSIPLYRKGRRKTTTSCQCGKRTSSSPCRVG